LTVPPIQINTLDPIDPLDSILVAARKANSTAMCLLCNSLTYKISQSALYNSKTTELPVGSAQKDQENLHKLLYPININKVNELKGEFVRSTLYKNDMTPDEWFADLNSSRQRSTDDDKLTTVGDDEMMNKIIFNTKPQGYQMYLTVIKYQLAIEAICFDIDGTYYQVTTRYCGASRHKQIEETIY
jgi:hypothetical protein